MKAKTPTATETLRIVVARLVNSVLMFTSIDAALLRLPAEFDLPRPRSARSRLPTSVSERACHDGAVNRAVTVPHACLKNSFCGWTQRMPVLHVAPAGVRHRQWRMARCTPGCDCGRLFPSDHGARW